VGCDQALRTPAAYGLLEKLCRMGTSQLFMHE
jgi:hypothetical protein